MKNKSTITIAIIVVVIGLYLIPLHIVYAHTADYWFGYKIGQEDGRTGINDVGSSCDHAPNGNSAHCIAGYNDGYKSICGTNNSRSDVACNSPPT